MLQNQILRTKLLNSMGLTARPNYLVSRYRKPHEATASITTTQTVIRPRGYNFKFGMMM